MKISNETKVGVLTVVAITLLILGFNFLKGKDVFNKRKKIYAIFSDLGSLEKSNDVKINGLPIGKVYDYNPKDKDVTGIVVTITLTKDVNIPDNSQAYISAPLVGASYIIIEKGNSPNSLQPGDTLQTRLDNGLLGDMKAQLNPTLVKVRSAIDSLTSVFKSINKLLNSDTKGNLQQTIANLNDASNSLKSLLGSETSPLMKSLNNVTSITDNLKKNNDSITATISNTKKLTEKLSKLDLQQTIDSVHSVLTALKATMDKITSKDGTIGALISDKELYNKLNDAVLSAEILMDDLRVHPKRYLGNMIFNRKDKTGPLTSPAKKDTLPSKSN
ncbi:MAG TPA: MlaD family protein [Chitinophagaceae bacterium]|nr:MlaD family protein [Chitinophagaceae bacterium]